MTTLRLESAAALLGISPVTLRKRAAVGTVPGYKPGKAWVFLEAELLDYLKSCAPCPSFAAQIRRTGGSDSSLTGEKFGSLLARQIDAKRRRLNKSPAPAPMSKSGSVIDLTTRGRTPPPAG
jgi:excisionase family DNA binding protein